MVSQGFVRVVRAGRRAYSGRGGEDMRNRQLMVPSENACI